MAKRKKTLYLVAADGKFPKNCQADSFCRWVFFGRDYCRFLELKKQAPRQFHFVDTGDSLQKVAKTLRRPYIDYIGSLSLHFKSLSWWISRISEKNTMVSPLFLYVCYIELLAGVRKQYTDDDICIFSESPALLKTISKLPDFDGYKIDKSYYSFGFRSYLRAGVNLAFFVKKSIFNKFFAFTTKHLDNNPVEKSSDPLTILRTWVGEKNLTREGLFKDSYFQGLSDKLQDAGKKVAVLPILFSIKRSYRKALLWFRKNRQAFLIPEDYYTVFDYCRAIGSGFRSLLLFRGKFVFKKVELSFLFREAAWRHAFEYGAMQFAMHYSLIKRLAKKGVKIERFILTFENMMPEKPLLMGLSEFYPKTYKIGFQHSVLYPFLLSLYVSPDEANIIPLPDQVICSGKFFRQKLIDEGYPADRVVEGPALRFQHLLSLNKEKLQRKPGGKNILIALPLSESGNLELLAKVWLALKNNQKIKLWIKAHPMMSSDKLDEMLSRSKIDKSRINFVSSPLREVMPKVDLMVATASGVVLDAVAFGLPVVRVQQDLDLSLDPMDWWPSDELQFVARTPDEIASAVERILSLGNEDLKRLEEKGRLIVEECFSPVNQKTMAGFLV